MYHFTFIEDTSMESGSVNPEMQEKAKETEHGSNDPQQNFLQKTAEFLHKYLNQPNCFRIFISKN
jgi:hypothetical protein